jgi:hypothetical protein
MVHLTPFRKYTLLTHLSDKVKSIIRKNQSTMSTQAKSTNNGLIPKPPGRRSRDFNIFDEMKADGKVEIDKETYNNLIVSSLNGLYQQTRANLQSQNSVHIAVTLGARAG